VANLLAVAAAAGWDARVLLGFVDPEVSGLLGLGEPEEYPLAVVTVAAPAAAEPTGSPLLEPSATDAAAVALAAQLPAGRRRPARR
jgi:hypothetical protein